jgi:probable rRNA maturation factor
LRDFLSDAAHRITPGRSVNCLITGDAELRELNRRFRRKDSPTDVLSFPGLDDSPSEIAISADRAAAQAAEFGHSLDEELRVLILHALLHLAGMDHETDSGEMARAEARWRRKLHLPAGLVERVEMERAEA